MPHRRRRTLARLTGRRLSRHLWCSEVQNLGALESYVASTQNPNSPSYHQFLSLPAFVLNFAPSSAEIFAVMQYLSSFGIQVTEVYADHLLIKATGPVDAFNKAFALNVHDFSNAGKRFHRPVQSAVIPASLKGALLDVVGPSDEVRYHANNVRLSDRISTLFRQQKVVLPLHGATATGVPQEYTVGDVANFYDINPLYEAGIEGSGRTIGIATLANFLPADAYSYWKLVGLQVNPNRITQVHVDGGGELSSAAGSGETSVDVEQSGGLAPAANIIVYDAPNNNAAFIDLFYKAASDNLVDSLSVSCGQSEVCYFQALNAGVDETGHVRAMHQAFLELAAQGISTFASAGDSGRLRRKRCFQSTVQQRDQRRRSRIRPGDHCCRWHDASDRVDSDKRATYTPPLIVSTQQVWGWDYLQNYLVKYLGPSYQNALFPGGGGGGGSIFWLAPAYQNNTLASVGVNPARA